VKTNHVKLVTRGVARELGDDDIGDFRQCFGSENGSGGNGGGRGSSSKQCLIVGSFGAVVRWCGCEGARAT
jgi:hypothetical protein